MKRVRVPRALSWIVSVAALFLMVVLAGCGVTGTPQGLPTAATVTVVAAPASIAPGGSSTLTVAATNATQVSVTGTDGSNYTMAAGGGTQAVTPAATTTYTATATGPAGKVTATATVTVTSSGTPPSAPPTVSIAASPGSITAGSTTTLTVSATNATQVTITGTDNSSYTLPAQGGNQSVSPSATTTYTATATGAGGKATGTAVVTVTSAAAGAPTVTIMANPATITAGASSTLTVVATNATQVTISGSDQTTYSLAGSGGTQSVSPVATTTYTATAQGPAGRMTMTATVTVLPQAPNSPPTVSITAAPTTIVAGNASTLTVTATSATTVTITGTDNSSYTLSPTGGSQAVFPTATTTYTATAVGAGGQVTNAATVTVTPAGGPAPAPTVTITANPNSVTAGSSSTLTVTATNATTVSIAGTDGSNYNLQPNGGTQAVTPTSTTTYAATASGPGGTMTNSVIVTVTQPTTATVTIAASPTSIASGGSSTLTVTATNANQVKVTGSDGSSYTLPNSGGTQSVTPTATTTYTATATGASNTASNTATVTVTAAGSVQSVDHVVFMLQENHTFDNYFGMLNPYRKANSFNIGDDGKDYEVDGIDDKLATISNQDDQGNSYPLFKFSTTCIDDETSAWLESYGDVNRYNFKTTRPIAMNGFVHTAEGFSTRCNNGTSTCSGQFTDAAGQRAMGYYDEGFLNYYYYMASQFAVSNRWFSPMSSKSLPNRIATFTGGTTQGITKDPGGDDKLPQLDIPTIFQELDKANVSWKIYYTVTNSGTPYPDTTFSSLSYSFRYLYENPTKAACTGTTQPSSVVGDATNSFCIDPNHIAPLANYFTDLTNSTLPSFSFIESGSGSNDEHPGSGQSILTGQAQVAHVINSFMASPEWKSSVFFLAYDEGGGPYDHVPPVPGHSNDNTAPSLGAIPDISSIAVNPDSYGPCVPTTAPATTHCDLNADEPGANSVDAAAVYGFGAQIGFRVPNMIISPFTRKHYVGNNPMDHTAILKFVENRFIGSSANLTARDAAQPNLLDFFDFTAVPWSTPPTPPAPVTPQTLGHDPCHAAQMQ